MGAAPSRIRKRSKHRWRFSFPWHVICAWQWSFPMHSSVRYHWHPTTQYIESACRAGSTYRAITRCPANCSFDAAT